MNKALTILLIALTILIISSTILTANSQEAAAAAIKTDTKHEKIINQLKDITGLSQEEIKNLYTATGDWDKIKENLYLYKELLKIAPKKEGLDIYQQIKDYEPTELLATYQFITQNNQDPIISNTILAENKKGKDLSIQFSTIIEEKYKNKKTYSPATKEQIKKWLQQGYTPEAILAADEYAKESDKTIEAVLKEPTKDTPSSRENQDNKELKEVEIKIKTKDTIQAYTGESYKTIIDQINNQQKEKQSLANDQKEGQSP